jgi:hypothetical protein
MRNIFDQYSQPENRLTHALAVCLDEDRPLLRRFLEWIGAAPPGSVSALCVMEQGLPGDPPDSENSTEHDGLPDIVIHDGDQWCVIVESKVQAALSENQLIRHKKTICRRGFERVTVVALTKAGAKVPEAVVGRTWSGLYEWLGKQWLNSDWSERLRSYLRVAEVRLAHDGYLLNPVLLLSSFR